MLRATRCETAGAGHGLIEDEVVLDFDQRHRRRIVLKGTGGLEFLLDLPHALRLRHGDALLLEDGRRVRVKAAAEPLAEIRAPSAEALVRIAWHLGNRHLPVMMKPDRLIIRRDHVIEDMAAGLGGSVVQIEDAFDPEGGAYSGGHHHHGADAHTHEEERH